VKSPREILARIESLVARASSPEKEEARTSAEIAVKLMQQYGIRLSLGDDHVVASATPQPQPPAPTPPPPKQEARPTSIRRVSYRCAGCASVVAKPGLCEVCVEARASVGIWNVVCEGCGRPAHGACTVDGAHSLAKNLGYAVTDDDRTLCQECWSKEFPWYLRRPAGR
jgi:hypothetical protein